jgi:acyl carrier protein
MLTLKDFIVEVSEVLNRPLSLTKASDDLVEELGLDSLDLFILATLVEDLA